MDHAITSTMVRRVPTAIGYQYKERFLLNTIIYACAALMLPGLFLLDRNLYYL